MNSTRWRGVFFAGLITITGLGMTSCQTGGPRPAPVAHDLELSVTPPEVCINRSSLVRVTWKVSGGDRETCMNVRFNDTPVLGDGVGPRGAIAGGRCGEGAYQREMTIDLREVFGTNIPARISVQGDLVGPFTIGLGRRETFATKIKNITTRVDCP